MTHQARYNAMEVEKYGCYCELYKCRPFCQIPKGKPKICRAERKPCFVIWGFILAGIVAMIISLCVTQIKPCEFDCGGNQCIKNNQHCDGVKDCEQWRDEANCSAKFKFVPTHSVGLIGRNGRIVSRAVLGDHELQWSITNTLGEVTTLSVRKDDGALSHEYGVRRRSQSNHVDLDIWHVQQFHMDYTYSAHLPSSGRTEIVHFIPTEPLSCTPSESGVQLAEGETATLVATVIYYGSTEPVLYWYKDNRRIQSSTSSVVGVGYTTLTVTATVTAQREDNDVIFRAHLFEAFPLDSIRTPPENSADICETRLDVLFPARNTRTDFEKKNEEGDIQTHGPGSEIKCSANGNPSPDLKWDCEDGEYIRYEETLTIPTGVPNPMDCTCIANNVIDGVTYTDEESISIKTSGAPLIMQTLSSISGALFIALCFL